MIASQRTELLLGTNSVEFQEEAYNALANMATSAPVYPDEIGRTKERNFAVDLSLETIEAFAAKLSNPMINAEAAA